MPMLPVLGLEIQLPLVVCNSSNMLSPIPVLGGGGVMVCTWCVYGVCMVCIWCVGTMVCVCAWQFERQ